MVELQVSAQRRGWTADRRWVAVFVAVELVVLLLIVLDRLGVLLPARLVTQIGHNSEAFVLAIVLSLTISVIRARRSRPPATLRPAVVVAVAVALFALGVVLMGLEGQPRVKTLNEPVFAAAFLVPYCALWPRRRALALFSVLALAFTVVFFQTDLVRLQAECLVALIMAPVGLDLAARWILAPATRRSRAAAYLWTGFLLVAPFVLMALTRLDLGAFLNEAALYAERGNEAFWGLFLVQCLALVAWLSGAGSDVGDVADEDDGRRRRA